MNQLLYAIGLTAIFIGLLLIFIGFLLEASKSEKNGERKTEYGGVIFIGPIPIVFGSNKKIAEVMLIIGLIIFVLIVLFFLISYL